MKAYGIPVKIIRKVQLLYQESECAVLDSGQTSEWFKVETGVKQGCVIPGFLFLLAVDLGAVVSTERGCGKDMDSRLSKARAAFRKLKRIWGSKQYNRRTKIKLRANVPKTQRFSKYRGNRQKINSAHILRLGRP